MFVRWMLQSFDHISSMLPIYFDRVQTFATPFYGFNVAALWNRSSKNDSNVKSNKQACVSSFSDSVTDFLRRQEKLGGPPTAVGLILNATGASNLHTERGFWLSATAAPSSSAAPISGGVDLPDLGNLHTSGGVVGNTNNHGPTEKVTQQLEVSPLPKLDEDPMVVQWPAVYLRSTLHLATMASITSSGRVGSIAASASSSGLRGSPRGSGLLRGPPGSSLLHLPTWSSSSTGALASTSTSGTQGLNTSNPSSPSGTRLRKQARISVPVSPRVASQQRQRMACPPRVWEYAPDTGTIKSWPHSDWKSLVSILDKQKSHSLLADQLSGEPTSSNNGTRATERHQLDTVITYRYDQESTETPELNDATSICSPVISGHVKEVASPSSDALPPQTTTPPSTARAATKDKRQSTFHVVSVGEWLNLVVVVKEEESRWHLRRNRIEEDEIREFLEDLSKKLSISNVLSTRRLRELSREQIKTDKDKELRAPMLHLPRKDTNNLKKNFSWCDENCKQDFLAELKEIFGLKPISPFAQDSAQSYNFYRAGRHQISPRTPVNPRALAAARRRRLRQRGGWMTSLSESAEALFLGPDVSSLLR